MSKFTRTSDGIQKINSVSDLWVPSTCEFTVTEEFLRKLKFSFISETFRSIFFGKWIKEEPERNIYIQHITRPLTGQQLKEELGDRAILSFAHIIYFVKHQANMGEILIFNGHSNLALVEIEGKEYVVSFYCRINNGRLWGLNAHPILSDQGLRGGVWNSNNLVFS